MLVLLILNLFLSSDSLYINFIETSGSGLSNTIKVVTAYNDTIEICFDTWEDGELRSSLVPIQDTLYSGTITLTPTTTIVQNEDTLMRLIGGSIVIDPNHGGTGVILDADGDTLGRPPPVYRQPLETDLILVTGLELVGWGVIIGLVGIIIGFLAGGKDD